MIRINIIFQLGSILSILIFGSCSYLIKYDNKEIRPIKKVLNSNDRHYCVKNDFQILGENNNLNSEFLEFYKKYKTKFSPVEFWAMLSLLHLKYSPTKISPSSFFSLLQSKNAINFYQMTVSDSKSFSFFSGIKKQLKTQGSRNSLRSLAKFLDRHYKNKMHISKELQAFLLKNKSIISNENNLKKFYLRGDQVLRVNEPFNSPSLNSILSTYPVSSSSSKNKFRKLLPQGKSPNCQFHTKHQNVKDATTYIYGLKINKNIFLTTLTQQLKLKTINKGPYLHNQLGTIKQFNNCYIAQNSNFIYMQGQINDYQNQQMKRLITNDYFKKVDISNLSKLIQSARYEFKTSPARVYIESDKMPDKKLQELLKIDFPLYHKPSIGKIIGLISVENNNENISGFVHDHRISGGLLCL